MVIPPRIVFGASKTPAVESVVDPLHAPFQPGVLYSIMAFSRAVLVPACMGKVRADHTARYFMSAYVQTVLNEQVVTCRDSQAPGVRGYSVKPLRPETLWLTRA